MLAVIGLSSSNTQKDICEDWGSFQHNDWCSMTPGAPSKTGVRSHPLLSHASVHTRRTVPHAVHQFYTKRNGKMCSSTNVSQRKNRWIAGERCFDGLNLGFTLQWRVKRVKCLKFFKCYCTVFMITMGSSKILYCPCSRGRSRFSDLINNSPIQTSFIQRLWVL